VATKVGGIPEVVEDGCEGLLVTPGNPRELAAAVVALLTDSERRQRMADAASRRGVGLSIDTAVRRTEAVYRQLVTAAAAGR
jgi:glycosyltransferase involved in cell wall biosynthesis